MTSGEGRKGKINIPKALRKLSEYLEDEPSEQALLTEYKACQHDVDSEGISYWTLTGIFIGFSSVLLGGLMYAIFTNNNLLEIILGVPDELASEKLLLLGITVSVLSISVIIILYSLRRWLRRVNFLQQINFERMHDIERELGMWKGWRVHGVDHWEGNTFDKRFISKKDEERLLEYKKPEWWRLWSTKPKRLWSTKPKYEQSSRLFYDVIFGVLFFLWSLILFAVWIPTINHLILASILVLVMAGIVAYFLVHITKAGAKE